MAYHHLTPSERKVIDSMRAMRYTQARIAQALFRSQSTISRELRRNGDRDGHYNPHIGNVLYWMRRQRLYKRTKRDHEQLMDYVRTKLNAKWSPQQIAGRLRYAEHRHNSSMWISHQTIYHFVAQDKAKGGKLFRHLRRGNKKFGKRGTGRHPNTFIRGRVSIDQRPPVVDQRLRVGDWEGDTFYGRHRKGCFCTLVERKTGFLATAIMPDASAQSLNDAVRQAFKDIPNSLVHTCTVDNGKEFARFKELEDQLDARFYFAHPYSAWERGLNENTNGLLRQFFPRKTDLTNVTPEQLTEVALCLNDRPRKRLNYRTPREALALSLYALDT